MGERERGIGESLNCGGWSGLLCWSRELKYIDLNCSVVLLTQVSCRIEMVYNLVPGIAKSSSFTVTGSQIGTFACI